MSQYGVSDQYHSTLDHFIVELGVKVAKTYFAAT
jgi:hypothetical protein